MRAVVLTVSDRVSAGEAEDVSGPTAAKLLEAFGFTTSVEVVPDGVESVAGFLRFAVEERTPLVVTTGGRLRAWSRRCGRQRLDRIRMECCPVAKPVSVTRL
jgi:hypothetical protein